VCFFDRPHVVIEPALDPREERLGHVVLENCPLLPLQRGSSSAETPVVELSEPFLRNRLPEIGGGGYGAHVRCQSVVFILALLRWNVIPLEDSRTPGA
jgi:hypothetical protein